MGSTGKKDSAPDSAAELAERAARAEREWRAANPDAEVPPAHPPRERTPEEQRAKDALRKWPKRERFAGFERDEEGFLSGFAEPETRWAPDQFAAMAHALRWIADKVLDKVDDGEPVHAEDLAMVRLGYEAAFRQPLHREWAFRIATSLLYVLALPPTEHEKFLAFDTDMFARLGVKRPWHILYEPPGYITNKVLRWAFAHITPTDKAGGGRLTRNGMRDLLVYPERLAAAIERDAKADRLAARDIREWIARNRARPPATCIFEGIDTSSVTPRAGEEPARMRLVNAIKVASEHLLMVDIFRALALRELAGVPNEAETRVLRLTDTAAYRLATERLCQFGPPFSDRSLSKCLLRPNEGRLRPGFTVSAVLAKISPYYQTRLEDKAVASDVDAAVVGWRQVLPEEPPADSEVWTAISRVASAMGMSARSGPEIATTWNSWGSDARDNHEPENSE